MIYFIRMRPLDMKDIVLARYLKPFGNLIKPFEKDGFIRDLPVELERQFVEKLVILHPIHEKNFEHFLIDPPDDMRPTDVLAELHARSEMIPTLCVVHTKQKDGIEEITSIERLDNHFQLLALLSHADSKGWVNLDGHPNLLGKREGASQ